MAKIDPQVLAHLEWIGFLQPTGLVVSATALVSAGALLDRSDAEGQRALRKCVEERTFDPHEGPIPWLPDFRLFADRVLGWKFSPKGYAGTSENPIPEELKVALPDYGETLSPTYAVREMDPPEGGSSWQLLVQVLDSGQGFDEVARGSGQLEVSAHGRMERLLRRTGVPAGLLFNGRAFRLVSAPRGESSGWMDFRVRDMAQTSGRPICTALRLLLGQTRLLTLPRNQRLAALLESSRKYQNEVSERLAEQVLHALYEFLRGFQSAHDATRGQLLREPLSEHPDEVYRGLLTVLLRLVFLLYAEERAMLPGDQTFVRYYSIAGLYERLREDAALFPDTMDQRYGAWGQLLALFRMVFDGAESGPMRLPRRHGALFDPDRFPFLEGRLSAGARQIHERIEPPLVPDGTIYRALEKLLVLDGERISYRALDVEEIGSVYETMMGFRLETTTGRSVAIKAQKKKGAPTAVDLEALLEEPKGKRAGWIRVRTERKLTAKVTKDVSAAKTIEDLHAALSSVTDRAASPDLVSKGAMVLQPSEERRRSGSHYTPRSLTEPIVRTTLEPILKQIAGPGGEAPRPEQILDLKVCDPAMGSGAFLVEACRQLGDALVDSWHAHGKVPEIPADEDDVVFARRLVAQRCLYGVDRNPMAVDLAKVSLWLVTLAKDHALTFLDHALRQGDSLVGLSLRQIEAFHWDVKAARDQVGLEMTWVRESLNRVEQGRRLIRESDDHLSDTELRLIWAELQPDLEKVRTFGNLPIFAFFEGVGSKERSVKRNEFVNDVLRRRPGLGDDRMSDPDLVPFHWDVEFPEVFLRSRVGFDALVGNPPFLGGSRISSSLSTSYLDWLLEVHVAASGNADMVAHFFRRAFDLVRFGGTFGLIATNTIAQGDTRAAGLRWICQNGGEIYSARKRLKWPGLAAVVVSVVFVTKGKLFGAKSIDGREGDTITAFLFHRGGHDDSVRLSANMGKSFKGAMVYGMGFTFDDANSNSTAVPISEMHRLIQNFPRNRDVIFPYIGGKEVNSSPIQAHDRYVINFGERDSIQCREVWPDLMNLVEERVRPEREALRDNADGRWRKAHWWQFGRYTPGLFNAIAGLGRVLVISRVAQHTSFTLLPANMVFSEQLIVFPFETNSAFCALQSRPHEIWARFFGSSMKDDLRYTPSDCFETFPFPENWESRPDLETVGKEYYEFRAALMIENDEGLTKTYNRFHDPDERSPKILKLRELHAAMDRAVLDAYGWTDISTDCEFLLDYEIDEEEWGKKKKPWRYRWPDEVHDEVLARLLELNAERAAEEARAGLTKPKKSRKKAGKKKARKTRTPKTSETGDLFE